MFMVVSLRLTQKIGQQFLRPVRYFAALPVIIVESARNDGLGDSLAALAAHGARRTADDGTYIGPAEDRLITVITVGQRVAARLHARLR